MEEIWFSATILHTAVIIKWRNRARNSCVLCFVCIRKLSSNRLKVKRASVLFIQEPEYLSKFSYSSFFSAVEIVSLRFIITPNEILIRVPLLNFYFVFFPLSRCTLTLPLYKKETKYSNTSNHDLKLYCFRLRS